MGRKKLIKKIGSKKDLTSFVDVWRKLYNDLCINCKGKTLRLRGTLRYELLCDECKIKAKAIEGIANDELSK